MPIFGRRRDRSEAASGATEVPDPAREALAHALDHGGLWRGLVDDVVEAQRRAVLAGTHPWATEMDESVQVFCDGEELAEGGVEAFLREDLAPALAPFGVSLAVETVSRAASGTYAVAVNDRVVRLYAPEDWDDGGDSHPWFASSVRPLGAVNDVLEQAGVVERWHLLYPGGNEGIALLVRPEVVAAVDEAGLLDDVERPLRC